MPEELTPVKVICSKAGDFKFCNPQSKYGCGHAVEHDKQENKISGESDCNKYCGCRENWGICVPVKEGEEE